LKGARQDRGDIILVIASMLALLPPSCVRPSQQLNNSPCSAVGQHAQITMLTFKQNFLGLRRLYFISTHENPDFDSACPTVLVPCHV